MKFACQYFCHLSLTEYQVVRNVARAATIVRPRRLYTAQDMPAAATMVDDVVAELGPGSCCTSPGFAKHTQRSQFLAECLRHMFGPGHSSISCRMAIEQACRTGVDELVGHQVWELGMREGATFCRAQSRGSVTRTGCT